MAPYLLLDLATAPLPNAADFIDADSIQAPSNWKDPVKIDAYRAEKLAERVAGAALDLDLSRITGLGWQTNGEDYPNIVLSQTDEDEHDLLCGIAKRITVGTSLISYNGKAFDWPLLMRRARYLEVKLPPINCDRYKSPHWDLLELLSGHDPSRRRSLGFYVKRLGWNLTKPLSGAEEAQVPVTGKWAELEASLVHDVEAIGRLASWLGVIT